MHVTLAPCNACRVLNRTTTSSAGSTSRACSKDERVRCDLNWVSLISMGRGYFVSRGEKVRYKPYAVCLSLSGVVGVVGFPSLFIRLMVRVMGLRKYVARIDIKSYFYLSRTASYRLYICGGPGEVFFFFFSFSLVLSFFFVVYHAGVIYSRQDGSVKSDSSVCRPHRKLT